MNKINIPYPPQILVLKEFVCRKFGVDAFKFKNMEVALIIAIAISYFVDEVQCLGY